MGMRSRELTPPPCQLWHWVSHSNAGELTLVVCVWKSWWADQLDYNPGAGSRFKLAHPNSYLIYEMLEPMKGQSYRSEVAGAT